MTLLFSTVLLSLAWFTVANGAASLMAWCLAARRRNPPRDGGTALCLRLLPLSTGVLAAGVLFAPAHVGLEPRGPGETFGVAVYAAALVALAIVSRSAWRIVAVVRAEWRLRRSLIGAVPMPASKGTPAWEVPWLQGVSLAGILRPCVLVGRAARLTLASAELDVAIAHELAHRQAHDNLKRFLMLCAPDLFGWTAIARRLESEWRAAAECAADGAAAAGDEERAATLASALVKVARLGAETKGICSPAWSTFHERGGLESRVKRLVAPEVPSPIGRRSLGAAFAVAAVITAGAWFAGAPAALHDLTEVAIQILP